MTPFNPLAYINASIQNNIGSFKNYLLEAKKKKSKPTADEEFEAHMASLIPYAAMASKRIRERQDIEDTDRMARARYYEAKAAEYLEKIKGFQAARKLIGATEKAKAQAAVERLAARVNRAKNPRSESNQPETPSLKSNQPEEPNLFSGLSSEQGIRSSVTPAPEEPNLFSGLSSEQGISSNVTPANPRKARGKNKRTTDIARGVIEKIKGSGDSDSSSAEQAADRAARRKEAKNKNKNKKRRPNSAA